MVEACSCPDGGEELYDRCFTEREGDPGRSLTRLLSLCAAEAQPCDGKPHGGYVCRVMVYIVLNKSI